MSAVTSKSTTGSQGQVGGLSDSLQAMTIRKRTVSEVSSPDVDKKRVIQDFLKHSHYNILIIGAGPGGLIAATAIMHHFPDAKIVIMDEQEEDILNINISSAMMPNLAMKFFNKQLGELIDDKHEDVSTKQTVVNRISFNQAVIDRLDGDHVLIVRGKDLPKLDQDEEGAFYLKGVQAKFPAVCGAGGSRNRRKESEVLSYSESQIYWNVPSTTPASSVGQVTRQETAEGNYKTIVSTKAPNSKHVSFNIFFEDRLLKGNKSDAEIKQILEDEFIPLTKGMWPREELDFSKMEGAIKGKEAKPAQLFSRVCFKPVQGKNYVSVFDEACSGNPRNGLGLHGFILTLQSLLTHMDDVGLDDYVMSDPEKAKALNNTVLEGHLSRLARDVFPYGHDEAQRPDYQKVFLKLYSEKIYGLFKETGHSFMDEFNRRIHYHYVQSAFVYEDMSQIQHLYPNTDSTELLFIKKASQSPEEFLSELNRRTDVQSELPNLSEAYQRIPTDVFINAINNWETYNAGNRESSVDKKISFNTVLNAYIRYNLLSYMEQYGGTASVQAISDNLPEMHSVFPIDKDVARRSKEKFDRFVKNMADGKTVIPAMFHDVVEETLPRRENAFIV